MFDTMNEKETIKYLDLIFKNITDFKLVSVNDPIFDKLNPKTKEEKKSVFKIVEDVKTFGINNELFIPFRTGGFFELTEKGKELKNSKLSYTKFEKRINKKPFDKRYVGYILIGIGIILSVVWRCEDNNKSDVLKTESYQNNDSLIDKQYNKIEKKEKTLLDTLQTKN